MPVALVVEGEMRSRARLAAYVRRVRGVSVITAASLAEVRVAIAIDPPDILVTAWRLPDGFGADVLRAVRAHDDPALTLVVLGEDEPQPSWIPKEVNVHVLRHPVSSLHIRKLLERSTRETLDRQPLLSPPEYLQLACMGRHDAVVECSRAGVVIGEIYVRDGQIWSALDEEGAGTEAFRRLVRSDALARLKTAKGEPPLRNVHGQWEHLLLDAARLEDEESRRVAVEPVPVDDSEVGRQVDEHLRTAARCVLHRDLESAATHFAMASALQPEDDAIQKNLDGLGSLGFQSDVES